MAFAKIAGVDEAGRGPLAGPVCAACVVLPDDFPVGILADSKKLSEKRREEVLVTIQQQALWAIGWASVEEIEAVNILQATFLAMRRAVAALNAVPERILVDGNQDPGLNYSTQTIVRGDDTEPCIMAASIVAKCSRVAYMRELDALYPLYGFARHKGYATQQHCQALRTYGPTEHHRKLFIKNILSGCVQMKLNGEES